MSVLLIESGRPRTTQIGGKSYGLAFNQRSIYADATLNLNNDTVTVDATDGNVVFTLGNATDASGKVVLIKKTDASANTVQITSAQLISGESNYYLRNIWDSVLLVSAVGTWFIISVNEDFSITRVENSLGYISFKERNSNELAFRIERVVANRYKAALPRIGGIVSNLCEKIALPTPTISGWTTNPAPLGEITNDDYAALATAGAITTANAWGYLTFDLGETYTLSLAVYGAITNVNTLNIHFSLDNTTFYSSGIDDVIANAGGNTNIVNVTGTGRYVRIGYQNQSAGTLSLTNCSVSAIGAPIA